jgi:CBS domain-containing protein
MSKAKEIMHWGAECVAASDTLETAARMMRDGHVGSLPICGPDNRLQGIITDRDIVVKCLAEGRDPKTTTAGDLAQGKPVWADADADADDSDVLRLMEEHQIRRLPVIEERRLVGMISEADLATHLPEAKIAEFAYHVYSAPPSL